MYSPTDTYEAASESLVGEWTYSPEGIPVFRVYPEPRPVLMPTSRPYEEYLVGELAVDFAEDVAENDFLRDHGIGSWLTAMPRRFPIARVEGGIAN